MSAGAFYSYTAKLLADLSEPRQGIHEDGTEELKTWEQLWEQCQVAAKVIKELQSDGPNESRDAVLEEAEDAMLSAFEDMSMAYLFTSGFDNRIIKARDAIRALKRIPATGILQGEKT